MGSQNRVLRNRTIENLICCRTMPMPSRVASFSSAHGCWKCQGEVKGVQVWSKPLWKSVCCGDPTHTPHPGVSGVEDGSFVGISSIGHWALAALGRHPALVPPTEFGGAPLSNPLTISAMTPDPQCIHSDWGRNSCTRLGWTEYQVSFGGGSLLARSTL